MSLRSEFVIMISANAEWQVIRTKYPDSKILTSPFGEWFSFMDKEHPGLEKPFVFFQGGWGKTSAAASTQYAISRWKPRLVVNIGTCGGFEGEITREEIILVEKTLIYDIYEQMDDPEEHINHYVTEIDTSWLKEPLPLRVIRELLVSADRDLVCQEIQLLKSRFGAIAGDWESGAIAWVAARNRTQCLILRGVTDLVGESGGEAYDGNVGHYYENTGRVMGELIETLPEWLLQFKHNSSSRLLK